MALVGTLKLTWCCLLIFDYYAKLLGFSEPVVGYVGSCNNSNARLKQLSWHSADGLWGGRFVFPVFALPSLLSFMGEENSKDAYFSLFSHTEQSSVSSGEGFLHVWWWWWGCGHGLLMFCGLKSVCTVTLLGLAFLMATKCKPIMKIIKF